MSATVGELLARADEWIAADPDPATRERLAAVAATVRDGGDPAELADLVGHRLSFGTAGLRGEMGPGSNRVNQLMARQTAAGLARTLSARVGDAGHRGVLVGHDARHGSERFARDIVDVLEGAGIPAMLVDGPQPTPLIAWGVRHLACAAGVVVTASHNPAKDNGIKIYWGDGAQIIPPIDQWIAADIDAAAAADVAPTGFGGEARPAPVSLVDDYVQMVVGLVAGGASAAERRGVRLATTAMHGVGGALLARCLDEAGFTAVDTVHQQAGPDPDFPTVPFPNPEEPGATDLLLALAAEVGADAAFANDPDADRLAVGVPTGDGGWRMLSGDELGAVVAAGLLERRGGTGEGGLLVTTVVSSQLLARMAAASGAEFAETLTGFKWLCRPAFEHPELEQILAYEESIGYAVGGLCDKDGISAAVVVADLIASWTASGVTVQDVLDDLARAHGAHVQRNFSLRLSGPGWEARLAAIAAGVVAAPPASVAGVAVARLDQPAEDVIRLFLENGDRVVIRPSGTEPKLKVYCEAVEPVGADEPAADARSRAAARLTAMASDLTPLLTPT